MAAQLTCSDAALVVNPPPSAGIGSSWCPASIATGARLSIGYAWRAAIAGEMLAGRRGVGWMIFSAQQADQTAQVILGMVLIGCLWILLDRYVLRPIESDTRVTSPALTTGMPILPALHTI